MDSWPQDFNFHLHVHPSNVSTSYLVVFSIAAATRFFMGGEQLLAGFRRSHKFADPNIETIAIMGIMLGKKGHLDEAIQQFDKSH